jgi:hypothetical protein
MTRKWHDLLGLFLIVALFLIEIPRYANTLPDHETLVAVGMGILLAGGAFYCVETWGMVKRSAPGTARIGWLAKMILVQIVLAPVIMTPQMAAQQLGVSVSEWLKNPLADPMLFLWTFVVTIAPVMVGGMVAFARSLQYGKGDLKVGQGDHMGDAEVKALKAKVRELEASIRSAESKHRARVQELEARVEQQQVDLTCSYCNQTFGSKAARAAHEVWCEKNPNGRRSKQPADNGKAEDA